MIKLPENPIVLIKKDQSKLMFGEVPKDANEVNS